MPKVTIVSIANLDNPSSVVSQLNLNFTALQAALENTLSRDGTIPNAMQSNLDMNSYRVLNLPVPVSPTEPARHGDIQQYVDQAEDAAVTATAQAVIAVDAAEVSVSSLEEFQSSYLGVYAADPFVDVNGNDINDGAIYYNSTNGEIRVFSERRIVVGTDVVVVNGYVVHADSWVSLPVLDFFNLEDVDISTSLNGDWMVWDGTKVIPVSPDASYVDQDNSVYNGSSVQDALDDLVSRTSLGIYDLSFFAAGLPGTNETLFSLVASRDFSIEVSAPGSLARLNIAPSGSSQVFYLQKNGVQFGTITFADGNTSGVFTAAGVTTFTSGDLFSIKTDGTVNPAVRDFIATIAAVR